MERCIAPGGTGSVYLGVQCGAAGFERPVAIKRTHGHLLETPEIRQTILQEARHASAVRHPNVVSIDDVEEVEDELLLVMDYVDGGSLSQLLKHDRLPVGVTLSIILDACAGLHAIHSATTPEGAPLGLVHRDVSPQNILVGLDGAARITDFGIAKGAGDPRRTSKTTRRGKFGYMAPEYLITGVLSASSDIFALGVVLWEALANRRLYAGESNMDSIRLTIDANVPSLHAMNPRVSPALDAVVRKALARDPRDRYRSMAELGQRLEAVTTGLVAPRSDVAAHVREAGDVRPSIQPTQRTKTSAAPQERMSVSSFDEVPSIEELVEASLAPPSLAPAAAVPRLPAPPRMPASAKATARKQSAHLHRAFRLDDRGAAEQPTRPKAPRERRSSSSAAVRLGIGALFVLLVSTTAALAYAGLSHEISEVKQAQVH